MNLAGKRVTVLGGGNTAFSMAANLALAGFEVLIWEHPAFAQTIEPIRESLMINLDGAEWSGAARRKTRTREDVFTVDQATKEIRRGREATV